LIGAEMDDPVSACECLEEIARVAQVSKPAWTQLLSRRNSIEAKDFVVMREQLTNNKLSQSTAAARNDDSFHLILFGFFLGVPFDLAQDMLCAVGLSSRPKSLREVGALPLRYQNLLQFRYERRVQFI
jgi:hypothetical protein